MKKANMLLCTQKQNKTWYHYGYVSKDITSLSLSFLCLLCKQFSVAGLLIEGPNIYLKSTMESND